MKNKSTLPVLLITAIITACSSNVNPVIISDKASDHKANISKSENTYLNKEEYAQLEKEYGQFNVKSFSKAYLEKKLNKWKAMGTQGDTGLAREIEFARIKHKTLYCDVMADTSAGDAALKEYIYTTRNAQLIALYPNQTSFATLISSNGCGSDSTLYSGLLGAWNMDNDWLDLVGGHNGTAINGTTFDTSGKVNQAGSFVGTTSSGNYVIMGTSISTYYLTTYSYSFWIKTPIAGSQRWIFSNQNNAGTYGQEAFVLSNKIYFDREGGNDSNHRLISTAVLANNTWHHIVLTRLSSTRSRIYIDGNLNVSDASTLNETYNSGLVFVLGYRPFYGYYWNGQIDAFAMWNKELTGTEVTELYNSGNGKQYPF